MQASPPVLPFGLRDPTGERFKELASAIVSRAEERLGASRRRGLVSLLLGLILYPAFALGVAAVSWGLGLRLEGLRFVVVVAVAFLGLALLGRYYKERATLASVAGGIGRVHRQLLAQAFVVRWITAAFFRGPYRVVSDLAHLWPRRPRVDAVVLTLAVDVLAALDLPITVRQLRRALPPKVRGRAVDEAVLLLVWSGLVELAPSGGVDALVPTAHAESLLGPRPASGDDAVRFSDLMIESGAVGSESRPAGDALLALDAPPSKPPAWLEPVLGHPLRTLAVAVAALVVGALGWHFGGRWMTRLDARMRPGSLPVVDANGVVFDGDVWTIARGATVRFHDQLGGRPEREVTLQLLDKLWAPRGGMADATPGDVKVYYERVDWAVADPSGRYLLVAGRWTCYETPNVSCGATIPAVVNPQRRAMMPLSFFEGFAYSSVTGWWGAGKLLAVRNPAPSWRGGGGRRSSDNLAPDAVAVDVESGAVESVRRAREPYLALAGLEDGRPLFLGVEPLPVDPYDPVELRLTEYLGQTRRRTFVIRLRKVLHPLLRQAELSADGRFWVLVLEEPPPEAQAAARSHYSIWLVRRDGKRWARVHELGERRAGLLQTFAHHGASLVAFHDTEAPPRQEILEIVTE